MPSTTTPTEDKIHGTDIAKILGIDYKEMAIDSILNEFLSVTQYKTENEQLAIGNLKSQNQNVYHILLCKFKKVTL